MALGYGNGYGLSYGLADPVSLLIPFGEFFTVPGVSPNSGNIPPYTLGSWGLLEGFVTEAGPITENMPDMLEGALTGATLWSFFDDFYNRVYVTPGAIDFGIVTTNASRTITVFNAYLHPVDLNSVAISVAAQDSQVSVSTPSLPNTHGAFSEIAYTTTATLAGPLEITGDATFTFSAGDVEVVTFDGLRGKLWTFQPNWSGGLTETWEYKTEVHTARSGREQRIALRDTPRKSIEFSVVATGDRRRELNRTLDQYQHVEHIVADLPRFVRTTADMGIGTDPVALESIPEWMDTQMLVVLVHGDRMDLRYVEAVNEADGEVTFAEVNLEEWPAGTKVCFAFSANFDPAITSRRHTVDVVEAAIRFDVAPGREDYVAPIAAPETYANREVFLFKPNWSETPQITFDRPFESVDFDRGIVERFNPIGYGSRLKRMTFSNRDYAETDALTQFFRRMRGQRGEFWLPTWEEDMLPRNGIGGGTSTLRVQGTEILDDYFRSDVFKTFMVLLKDGTRHYRRIVTMFETNDGEGNDTILQLEQSWASTISQDDIMMICWMPCARLASDSLTIQWVTNTKSQFQLTTRTLEYLAAE